MAQNYTVYENQNSVNDDKSDNKLPLHLAVLENNMAGVRECIFNGINVNLIDEEGNTALFYCTSLEVAKFLVENGTDVNIQNKYGFTAVVYLYQYNRKASKYLIPFTDLDLMGHHVLSATLLGWMILNEERDFSLIKMVISKTKDLNKLNKRGDSYLINAAQSSGFSDVVIALIEAGCDMYIKDRAGKNFYDLAFNYVKKIIEKKYPEFIYCKDLTEQQRLLRQRELKLKHLNSLELKDNESSF